MSKQLKIITIGTTKIGLGHFKRMISLSRYFLKQKWGVDLELLPGSEIESNLICEFPTKKIKPNPDLIICDFHDDAFLKEDFTIKNNIPIVCFDYFGKKIWPELNIILFNHGKTKAPGKNTVEGFKYFMLRNEIINHPPLKNENYILVSLGGSDALDQTEVCLEQLTKLFNNPIVVIYGPLVKKPPRLKDFINVTRYTNPENYVDLLSNCSLAICNGGSTMFEMLFLKKKCWVIPQSSYEKNLAQFFANKNWILGSGVNLSSLKEKFTTLILNYDHPIGTLGSENILKEIEMLLLHK